LVDVLAALLLKPTLIIGDVRAGQPPEHSESASEIGFWRSVSRRLLINGCSNCWLFDGLGRPGVPADDVNDVGADISRDFIPAFVVNENLIPFPDLGAGFQDRPK